MGECSLAAKPVVGYFDCGEPNFPGQVSNFEQTPPIHERIFSGSYPWRGVMHDSKRYRDNAADCLLVAQDASQPYYRLHVSMAISWLSLARQDEAVDTLLASWGISKPTDLVWGTASDPFVSGNRL
jgi:hypothetical protein